MFQKISDKSPNPDPSMHPKLTKDIFLKNRSSCIDSVLGLDHSSRSVISSLFVLGYRGAQKKPSKGSEHLFSSATSCGTPVHLPPAATWLPSRRAFLHLNCGTLCHRTQAVFISLKSHNVNGSSCLTIWLGGIEDTSWLEDCFRKGLDGVFINYNRICSRDRWLRTGAFQKIRYAVYPWELQITITSWGRAFLMP